MAVSPILPAPVGLPASSSTDIANAAANADADFETFLTLLTSQLENQDPLEPIDSTQFVAQLASFSSVEQLIDANERLDTLATQSSIGDIAGFASWIGRDVATTDGVFNGTGTETSFAVPDRPDAKTIMARVIGSSGAVIQQIDVSALRGGLGSWDGRDGTNAIVRSPGLKIELDYFSAEGTQLETQTAEVLRRVTGIRGTETGIVLDLSDARAVAPDTVSRLSAAPETDD